MIKIFVGSSAAAKSQAKAFINGCSVPEVVFLPWWDQFTAGRTLLEELSRIRSQVNRAILIMSPESFTKIRGHQQAIPNLNVLFEFGFFYHALGKEKVAVVRYGNIYLPSDLDGYIHITGSNHFKGGSAVAVGKRTKTEFGRWLHPHQSSNNQPRPPQSKRPTQQRFGPRPNWVTGWRK